MKTFFQFRFLFLQFILIKATNCDGNGKILPEFERLRQHLVGNGCWPLDNYPFGRPALERDEVVNVEIGIFIDFINDMSDSHTQWSLMGTLNISWNITCASWQNYTDWNHISWFNLPSKDMWMPKITHMNCKDRYFIDQSSNNIDSLILKSSGTVLWAASGIFDSFCIFNYNKFPFDTQHCSIVLESWNVNKLVTFHFDNSTLLGPNNDRVKDFIYQHGSLKVYEKKREHGEHVYDQVIFEVELKRDPNYYTIVIIMPIMSLILFQCLSFFLPLGTERCSFLMTIVLAMGLLQSVVDNNIPHVAQTVLLVYFIYGVTMMSTFTTCYAILWSFVVSHNKSKFLKKTVFNGQIRFTTFIDVCSFFVFTLMATISTLIFFIYLLS